MVIRGCYHLRHPRMLLSGDLLKRLFKVSQPVWEIPDEYCVFSGITVNFWPGWPLICGRDDGFLGDYRGGLL